ncbi:hypothetical protein LCGC14_1774210 [marine sediment metagenome]|uniref:Uncharacterized protein n=1 Tax=marine sediment metagenome TaxID=412755 RepID=A0A0F9JCA3_9ZZZZ
MIFKRIMTLMWTALVIILYVTVADEMFIYGAVIVANIWVASSL